MFARKENDIRSLPAARRGARSLVPIPRRPARPQVSGAWPEQLYLPRLWRLLLPAATEGRLSASTSIRHVCAMKPAIAHFYSDMVTRRIFAQITENEESVYVLPCTETQYVR